MAREPDPDEMFCAVDDSGMPWGDACLTAELVDDEIQKLRMDDRVIGTLRVVRFVSPPPASGRRPYK